MLKNNSLLGIVYGTLFLLILGVFFISKIGTGNDGIVFSYPEFPIDFSGEEVPTNNYFNKERFDKEFLNTSNNLYQFYLYVKRYPVYAPEILTKLKSAGIPEDFIYLPIAESALRNDVVSSAGAAGIWQFMPDTARDYGLIVNDFVDERYHFEKSTDAAIAYIKDLYLKFGNWTLVAASYNRGQNAIARALDEQNVESYYDLYLNEETSRYVFRILAIKYMMISYFERQDFINKVIGGVHKKPDSFEISVGKIDNISLWASENGYRYSDIKILNRWIIGQSLPDGDWTVLILKD